MGRSFYNNSGVELLEENIGLDKLSEDISLTFNGHNNVNVCDFAGPYGLF
jgi:hypothetical protein